MKSLTKLLLLAALATGTAGYTYAKPLTTVKTIQQSTQDRHLSGFRAIDLAGSFDVYITQGSTESVKVEAPSNVIDRIVTEVEDGVLKIHSKKDSNWNNWGFGNKKMVIYVTAKDLNGVSVTGSGDIFFRDGISTNTLKLNITGSGDMQGKVNVKKLESRISGSGDMSLSGRADDSSVSVVGSGDFKARELVTVSTAVRVAGSGDATVNASNKVDASVSGSGDIHYTGGAKNISSSKAGSGDISRL